MIGLGSGLLNDAVGQIGNLSYQTLQTGKNQMINAQEHFYHDDPNQGHPDVRTRLKDVNYFFIGNGHILAAVQLAPSGEGTPLGLLILNPDQLGKKREALTMNPGTGLEASMIYLEVEKSTETIVPQTIQVGWCDDFQVPTVKVTWQSNSFQVTELFYCPDRVNPVLIRELHIKNIAQRNLAGTLMTGVLKEDIEIDLPLNQSEEIRIFLRYVLNAAGKYVQLDPVGSYKISDDAIACWNQTTKISFNSPLLDRFFKAAKIQQATTISKNSIVDASIWQYNGEWVRDHSMMAIGLILAGHHEMARKMIVRLFHDFVTEQGDTVDSSQKRHYDEVELDQNGILIYALKQSVCWTGDFEIIKELWDKIKITVEFPLQDYFRHAPSGLLVNQREYWERHRVHGIEKGIELAYQFWVSMGLSAAASLARMISKETEALRWDKEAARIKTAMLNDPRFKLVDERGFIKRRRVDGTVQELMMALPEAELPRAVPLSAKGEHLLNPDTSSALPIAFGFIDPKSPIAIATMKNLEILWNQSWEGGGYGRYHVSSEPDSPGAWPFPSLFLARAYLEMGEFEKVWRILNWLNTIPGSKSGSWFEFYGQRLAPPFPQVGITPWTWSEMLMLLVHHIVGIQPELDYLRIRPRLLPGIDQIEGCIPFRDKKLNFKIQKVAKEEDIKFRSNNTIIETSSREAKISFSKEDTWIEAFTI